MAKVAAEVNIFDHHHATGPDRPKHLPEQSKGIRQMRKEKSAIDAIVLSHFNPILHVHPAKLNIRQPQLVGGLPRHFQFGFIHVQSHNPSLGAD